MRSHPLAFLLPGILAAVFFLPSCSDNPAQSGHPPFPDIDPLDTENQADYLMITPRNLAEGLHALVDHREDEGHTVAVVTLEQIAEAFPEAPSVEEGIRSFIAYAHDNWKEPIVEYVLLVGDTDLIPTYFFQSSLSEYYNEDTVAIDDPYSTLKEDDDDFPDLALGRFPVSNLHELATVVNKTLSFEEPGSGATYGADALIVTDYVLRFGTIFETQADALAMQLPAGASITRIDLREDSPYFGTRDDFLAGLRDGARTLAYLGSANDTTWSESGLLTLSDVPVLPANGKPSLVVSYTSSQKFQDSGHATLIRELILLESGGSVASVAPSGLSSLYAGNLFLSAFWEDLWSGQGRTIGEAVLAAKRKYEAGRDDDFQGLMSRFTLLGDPALRVRPQTS